MSVGDVRDTKSCNVGFNNTSTNPIGGNFSNLPDGAVFTVGVNNFQASYEGGDATTSPSPSCPKGGRTL